MEWASERIRSHSQVVVEVAVVDNSGIKDLRVLHDNIVGSPWRSCQTACSSWDSREVFMEVGGDADNS